MTRLTVPAAYCAILLSGCATPLRPGAAGAGAATQPPLHASPHLGESSAPPPSGDPADDAQTLRKPVSPQTPLPRYELDPGNSGSPSNPSDLIGPSLGDPQARRRSTNYSTARIEAPAPRREHTTFRPMTQLAAGERANVLHEPTWSRFYRSTDGQPLQTAILGRGGRRIALLASLHGDEPQSVGLVEELSRHLNGHPELLRNLTVLLIRTPNPDGLTGRSPYNIQGVDLNRNFPSDNWKPLRSNRAGAQPGSEIETRGLVRMLSDFKPQLVIHLKDARSTGIINVEGENRGLADQLSELTGLQVTQNLGQQTSGSLERFTTSHLQAASLTLLLPCEPDQPAAWAKHQAALVTALRSAPPHRTTTQRTDPAGPRSRAREMAKEDDPFESPTRRPTEYPRKTLRKPAIGTGRGDGLFDDPGMFPSAVPDVGYVELPPAP